jgi:hypothetical protein
MKSIIGFVFAFFAFHVSLCTETPSEKAGFFLADNHSEVTLKYHSTRNLIVLPVTINDTVKVNLILDTGCRNLVLFGKKLQKYFKTEPDKKVQFSGLGNGSPVNGKLSLNNKVSIQAVIGEKIPIVIVPQQNLFSAYANIHGVIGYDIFIKFEIELNPMQQLITFRPAREAILGPGYEKIPLRIEDSRPIIQSHIFFPGAEGQVCDVMVDTGSTLGLLVKITDINKFPKGIKETVLGRGFNGDITGVETTANKLVLNTFEIDAVTTGVTYSAWHNYESVGMEVIKNYTIVLNYCQSYAGFKRTM